MNLSEYHKAIDVWEGSLDIDEPVLLEAKVEAIFPRLNDTVGGIHLDSNFHSQWEQSERFGRVPYYVVAPWIYAKVQLEFVLDNLPKGCRQLMPDVELTYTEKPESYRTLYDFFLAGLARYGISTLTYTAPWAYPFLSQWPLGDYLLARYPFFLYPERSETISWAELDSKLQRTIYAPPAPPRAGATVVGWQCTADRYKLPGCCGRAVDIIVLPDIHFNRLFPPRPSVYTVNLPLIRAG